MQPTERERASYEALFHEIADAVTKVVSGAPRSGWNDTLGMGADGTPTKRIDKVAEDAALEVLRASGSGLNVVSEECGVVEGSSDLWVVMDPIDGTTNAARGIPFFCVSLALGRKDTDGVVYGLTRNIPTGDTYEAWKGGGARKDGKAIRARRFPESEKPTFSLVLGARANPLALQLAQRHANVRALGAAALDLCLLAEGALDLYYHGYGSLRVTDIAASLLILREAGGQAYDGSFKPLNMELSLGPRTSLLGLGDPSALSKVGGS